MEVNWIVIIAAACILSFLVGFLLGRVGKHAKIDGKLLIGTVEDRDRFEFIFTTELEDLQNQKQLTMEIVKTQNLQTL